MAEAKDNPPTFCEKFCIICKYIQDIELKISGKNGCIWGAARKIYYGVTPDQKLPKKLPKTQK